MSSGAAEHVGNTSPLAGAEPLKYLPYERQIVRDTLSYTSATITALPGGKTVVDFAKPYAGRVLEYTDPVVTKVDEKVSAMLKAVNDRVLAPAAVKDGKLTAVGLVRETYSVVLDLSDDAIDYVLPGSDEEEHIEGDKLSIARLGSKVSRRVKERVAPVAALTYEDIMAYAKGSTRMASAQAMLTSATAAASDFSAKVSIKVSEFASAGMDWTAAQRTEIQTALLARKEALMKGYQVTVERARVALGEAEKTELIQRALKAYHKAQELNVGSVSEYALVKMHFRVASPDVQLDQVEGKLVEFFGALGEMVYLQSLLQRLETIIPFSSAAPSPSSATASS
jgi:hypothetical protein